MEVMRMRPIQLRFSGLQSYKEKQEVDFQWLGDMGIFGIFGPTGAGKSTILDAITLALYGNIERAPNGIRGIMNHFEDELSVSFEFLLGKHRYRAERSYKRTKKDDSIINRVSRLIQVEEEDTEVLADKATEVTSKVEELLGMKFKDFTRAVIIPQNKFDQFLKLTEGERTEMLEKIFCLEDYGEKLTGKVKKLEKKLDAELESNRKIMLELGDASQEAVFRVKEALKTKKEEAVEKKQEQIKLEEKLKTMETAAGIHQEMDTLKEQKMRLEGKQQEIENNKKQLHSARKAEGLKGPLKQINLLENQIKGEEDELKKQEILENQINEAMEKTKIKLEKGKENQQQLELLKKEELPKLPLATSYEGQIMELEEEVKESTNMMNQMMEKLVKTEKALQDKNDLVEKIEEIITHLKKRSIKMKNILHCRKEIDDGVMLLKTLDGEEKQVKVTLQQLESKNKLMRKEEKSLKILVAEHIQSLKENVQEETIEVLMEMAEKVLQQAIKQEQALQEALDKAKDQNMARVLASKLKKDEPCQVCGSLHHPKPANNLESFEEDTILLAKEKVDIAKERVNTLRKWQQKIHIQYTTYQGTKREIESTYHPTYIEKSKEFNKAKEEFEKALLTLQKKVHEIAPNFVVADRDTVNALKERLEKAEQEYQQVSKTIDEKEALAKELYKEITSLKENNINLQSTIKAYKENVEKSTQRLKELISKKKVLIGDATAQGFEEKIRRQIDTLEKEIKEIQELWEDVNKKKQELQQSLTTLKSGIEKSKEHLKNLEIDLRENLINAGFKTIDELQESLLETEKQKEIEEKILNYENALNHTTKSLASLEEKVAKLSFDKKEFEESKATYKTIVEEHNQIVKEEGALQNSLTILLDKQKRWGELQGKNKEIAERKQVVASLFYLLRGKRFVKFLAEEHMRDMTIEASIRLGELTGQRYGLELDDKCSFIMRDEYNNGIGRLVTSLSGGETFLTSLALALALSSKIQLKGKPLGFFFLDEGFGTLDHEKLELVMNTLEKLQRDRRMVGIISHVEELKNRMPRYIEVTPAQQNGAGSRVLVKSN